MNLIEPTVPVNEWGLDHWSTLLYAYLRTLDGEPLQESKMRGPCHACHTKNGTVDFFDDWDCLTDAAFAGFIRFKWENRVVFTESGHAVIHKLMIHKCNGGSFNTFYPDQVRGRHV